MSEKTDLLYELGKTVREYGKSQYKGHGHFWRVTLKSGIQFQHDDYNHSVKAYYPDGSHYYFGSMWGGFTGQDVSVLHYKATIELLKSEARLGNIKET